MHLKFQNSSKTFFLKTAMLDDNENDSICYLCSHAPNASSSKSVQANLRLKGINL